MLGVPPSSPLQPYDQAAGCVRFSICLAVGDWPSGSHAGLQSHQGQWRQDPVFLLHLIQRGVPWHHHPGGHAPHPDSPGVHLPNGYAVVLFHPDLQLPKETTDGKDRQGAQGDESVCGHRHGVYCVLPAHNSDHHRGVGHSLVSPVGLWRLLHLHPAHHRLFRLELLELRPGPNCLRVLQLHVQKGPVGHSAPCLALRSGVRREHVVFRVHQPTGAEVHES